MEKKKKAHWETFQKPFKKYQIYFFHILCHDRLTTVAIILRCSVKKIFLKNWQNSQQNTRIVFNKVANLQPATL